MTDWSKLTKKDFGDQQFNAVPDYDVLPDEPPDHEPPGELDFTKLQIPMPEECFIRTWSELEVLQDRAARTRRLLTKRARIRTTAQRYASTRSVVVVQNMRAEEHGYRGVLDDSEWRAWRECFGGLCAYCGEAPRVECIEHVVPVSRGGANDIHNVVPACYSCNRAKAYRDPIRWLQKTNRLEEFLRRVVRAHERMQKRKSPT